MTEPEELWRKMWDELDSLPVPEAPEDARARARAAAMRELPGRRIAWMAGGVAAAVVLFVGGFLFGTSREVAAPAPGGPGIEAQYALVIRGRVAADEEAEVAARMAAWARRLAGADRLAYAERLAEDSAVWVGARGDAAGREPPVSGLFLVRAASLDDARRLAEAAPHLAFGGAVEVLPIGRH